MSDQTNNGDTLLDRAAAEIRDQALAASTEDAITARVWERIVADAGARPLHGCPDFQALISGLVAGTLPAARALLVEDHTRECIACRRLLMAERSGSAAVAAVRPATRERWHLPVSMRWAAAAALVLGVGLVAGRAVRDQRAESRLTATVATVDGALQLVTGQGLETLSPGDVVRARTPIRTADGAHAMLRLADGSLVELDQRSQVGFRASRRGTRIELERGNIIVQAAPQRDGRLWVSTKDCLVGVRGTIFSVNHGLKGSRVSVIEGEVEVRQGPESSLLYPGDQVTTDARLRAVPVEDEIAWSRNAEQHVALMRELRGLHTALSQAVTLPEERTSTRLLELCPADTLLYAALPNLTEGLATARTVLEQQLATSATLRAWWDENVAANGVDRQIDELLDRLQPLGDAVGDEVVVAVPATVMAGEGAPLVLATLIDPAAFSSLLAAEIERVNAEAGRTVLALVDDPWTPAPPEAEWLLWVHADLFAAATELGQIQVLAGIAGDPSSNPFRSTQLHGRLAEAYANGVGWLFGLDVATALNTAGSAHGGDLELLRQLGLLDASTLVVERHSEGERTATEAVLQFDGPRRGVAAWLAEPAPMASLEFVSSSASLATAVVAKDPAVMFDELVALLAVTNPQLVQRLESFAAEHGIDLRADLASPLGGEAALAVDGPLLPTPAWKLIVEVYDPTALERSIGWAVDEINRALAAAGRQGLEYDVLPEDDATYHRIRHLETGYEIHFLIVDRFLVATPSRQLLDLALQHRASGTTLPRSAAFRELLPANGYVDCSGLSYRNLSGLAEALPAAGLAGLDGEALALLSEMSQPSLYCAYGEPDRIVVAGSGGGLLAAVAPLLGLQDWQQAAPGVGTAVAEGLSSPG